MYADPTHLRANAIKSRYNDQESDLVHAVAKFNGMQPAVFVREAVMAACLAYEKGSHGKKAA